MLKKKGEKEAQPVEQMDDLDTIMKKYDRESNTRIFTGTPKLIVRWFFILFSQTDGSVTGKCQIKREEKNSQSDGKLDIEDINHNL